MILTQPRRIELINRQIDRIDTRLAPLRLRSNRLSWLRVVVFLGGVVACVVVLWWTNPWLFALTLLASLAALIFVVYHHNQLDQTIARFEMLQTLKREQIARFALDWNQIPAAFTVNTPADHPFAADLDISGDFSLHRSLDCAASRGGSQRLYEWLTCIVIDVKTVKQRQQLVRELIPLHFWRDRLSLYARLGAKEGKRFDPAELLAWLQKNKEESLITGLTISFGLLAVTAILGLLNWLGMVNGWWQYSYLAYFALQLYLGRATGESFTQASALQDGLERLMAVMHHVEKSRFRNAPNLRQFCAPIADDAHPPSQSLRQIRRIAAATGIQSNPVVAFVCNALFPWNLFFAHRLRSVKSDLAQRLPQWLDIWYGLEALNSLATFAWLHPDHNFPKILSENEPFSLQSQQLGHPLIPDTGKVRNDFVVDQLGDLALITGSNMAGKSTFLRTMGLNLLLAFAGSVIDGRSLEASPMRLFTSIKISDSVTQGVSFFYAEVKRLKRLLDELERTDTLPLFFCIDEIFRGTNNRERLLGSRSYIRRLVGKHGVGLISTHDLELVKLEEELPQITNYHFRDDIVDNEMVFDYKLHPGPCPTTNALKVMSNAGLPVDS